ncbi:GAF domain-containing protein [Plebeiibacterium sediminum]|uniref:GAF domain-containing protein n=1 Tax=Plebeiibacterium sediminum TaxID=2992112 RepID=A0AAE3M1I4_9BACT|nr:GAF domain-containing protein [Plebeiobacterium sediminum]MCW3785127.1 hypothetical protein [Plebeiobacterium sediminum]
MKKKPVFILYILAIAAFVFALSKYLFIDEPISASFLVFEIFSFIGFIGIIYFTDRLIRQNIKDKEDAEQDFKQLENELLQKNEHLKKTIENLKNELNTDSKSSDEIDIIKNDLSEVVVNNNSIKSLGTALLNKLAKHYEIGLGVCYFKIEPSTKFSVQGVYGLNQDEVLGEIDEKSGISGECITNKNATLVSDVDEDYFNIESCSGSSKPKHLYLLPIVVNNETVGLIELATFKLVNIERHWNIISEGLKELKVL